VGGNFQFHLPKNTPLFYTILRANGQPGMDVLPAKYSRRMLRPAEVDFVDVTEVQQILKWRSGRPADTAARMGMYGHVGGILSVSPPDWRAATLLSVRLAQSWADAQTQQPQRTRNQFVPAQQENNPAVEVHLPQ